MDDGVHAPGGEVLVYAGLYLLDLVPHYAARGDLMPGLAQRLPDGVAAGIVLLGAGVADGQDGGPDVVGGRLAVLADALAQNATPPPVRNGLLARSSPIVVAGP